MAWALASVKSMSQSARMRLDCFVIIANTKTLKNEMCFLNQESQAQRGELRNVLAEHLEEFQTDESCVLPDKEALGSFFDFPPPFSLHKASDELFHWKKQSCKSV